MIYNMLNIEAIKDTLESTSFSDVYIDNCDTIKDIYDSIETWISEQDIIYYSNAMEYLSENDASLTESMGLAFDMGYGLADLNSETLATILYQHKLYEELSELELKENDYETRSTIGLDEEEFLRAFNELVTYDRDKGMFFAEDDKELYYKYDLDMDDFQSVVSDYEDWLNENEKEHNGGVLMEFFATLN